MKLTRYAKLVKGRGYCLVCHVGTDCTWLGTTSAIYRAPGLPYMEGDRQVQAVLDLPDKAWQKVHFQEEFCETTRDIMGMNLASHMDGEEQLEKVQVMTAPNGVWAACFRGKRSGELIFYNQRWLSPLDEVETGEYIVYTARRDRNGGLYIVVHDGFHVLAAIKPMQVLNEKYLADLQEFQALCMEQFLRERDRTAALEEVAETEPEQIGMEQLEA